MASDILSTAEIEHIVEHYQAFHVKEIGSEEWFRRADKLCKLYMVAAIEVRTDGPERIKSALSANNKISDFTKDLLCLAVWKEKVLPVLLSFKPKPEKSFPIYIILYCEVTLVGLIESLLFHGEMFWDLGDLCLDLIDYSVDKLINISPNDDFSCDPVQSTDIDALTEIKEHQKKMNSTISASCVTILRYIAENFDKLSLSTASRIYTTYDVPLVVASLLVNDVWSRKKDGKVYKFENSNWREWRVDDPILSHLECQTWLLLRQLLLNKTCDTIYYYNEHRKEYLSKLTRFLYDSVVDQLSPLAELKIWLHRLSITNNQESNAGSNPLIMEINESYRDKLLIEFDGTWEELATEKAHYLLYPKPEDVKQLVGYLNSSFDGMVLLDENIHSCHSCFAKALKRCSKCQKAWYCSRKCQVDHWKLHKAACCK